MTQLEINLKAYPNMRYLLMIATIFFLQFNAHAQKRISYGFGIDMNYPYLAKVDQENFSRIGHSWPGFNQKDKLGIGVKFLATMPISRNISLGSEFGITYYSNEFFFDYTEISFPIQVHEELNISLFYVRIPIKFTFHIPSSSRSNFYVTLGLDNRFLWWGIDNYKDITYITGGFETSYNFYIPSLIASIGYNFNMPDGTVMQLGLNCGFDQKSIVGKDRGTWGFYENLSSASYQNYGISVNYFFIN
jgi:hypothetical protein